MAFTAIPIESEEQWLELRKPDVTASTVGALRNLHPFSSRYRLFKEKSGFDMGATEPNVRMRRGKRIEKAVAAMVMEDYPEWHCRSPGVYLRDPERRIGATPDFYIDSDDEFGLGVLQTKITTARAFKRSWMDETGALMVPPWIVLQTTTEMMLADAAYGAVGCFIDDAWNDLEKDLYVFRLDRHAKAEARILQDVAEFWDDVANGREPEVDPKMDGALVRLLHQESSDLVTVDLTGDNYLPGALADRALAKERIAADQALVDEIDTYVASKMGDAELGFANGFTITAKSYRVKPFWNAGGIRRPIRIRDVRPKEIKNDGEQIKF